EKFKRIFNEAGERIYRLRASRKGWIMRKILKDPLRLVKRVKQDPTKAVKTLLYLLRRPKRAG
ncbi:MAG: hypothetical protein QF673_04030, partial [Candidatus Hydrothermarchaeota archaeon]|nr:hypothetical protein [Candidatus Hydrothermarchaeota archaeon]